MTVEARLARLEAIEEDRRPADTAHDAIAAGDRSRAGLAGYRRRLESTFVLKDHRKGVLPNLDKEKFAVVRRRVCAPDAPGAWSWLLLVIVPDAYALYETRVATPSAIIWRLHLRDAARLRAATPCPRAVGLSAELLGEISAGCD